ncbi:MAG: ABC transporter permease [Acidobacteriia bacterium]|nr:ABC transporter permease [Terriglobia bacterium]
METLWQDLRYGARSLRRSPGFTLMAVLVVTLGIGANTAIFSVVHAVLLQQLPFKDPSQLVTIYSKRTDVERYPSSIPDFQDFQNQSQSFDGMAALAFSPASVTGQGEPERLQEARVSANYFQVTGTSAYLGRTLIPDDDNPGSAHVVVLNYGLWQRRFGGDRAVVGKSIELNGEAHTIVGVLPEQFFFPIRAAEMAVPLSPQTDPRRANRQDHFLNTLGRLKPGVTAGQAAAELNAIAQHLQQQYPQTNGKNSGVTIVSLYDEVVGEFRSGLLILQGAVALLLLIACSSLANLLLARGSARTREIAIRTALGGDRKRIIRQLVTETVLLASIGGVCGILLAAWGVHLLVALSPAGLPRSSDITVDATVLAFAAGLSVIAGLVFGVVPALQCTDSNFDHLRSSGASGAAGGGSKARAFIVAAQVALSLVLLVASGLLLKSFARLQSVSPGFDPEHALSLRLSLPATAFPDGNSIANFYSEMQRRIQTLPGVSSVGAVSILPTSGALAEMDFTVVGHPPDSRDHMPTAQYRVTGEGYFRAMSIPLLQGRELAASDTSDSAKVAVVNETLARRHFANVSQAIGAHLHLEDGNEVEIVGVVPDIKQFTLDEDPQPDIYVPYPQVGKNVMVYLRSNMFCVVRTTGDPAALAAAAKHEIRSVQGDVAISRILPMTDYLAATVAPRRFNLLLVVMFGAVALLIAMVGVYGVISYSVSRRTREFGVRMALGAGQGNVIGVVLAQAGRLVGAGIIVGLIGSIFCTRLLSGLLFRVKPTDIATFSAVVGAMLVVATLACLIPARRAARVDPLEALRYE